MKCPFPDGFLWGASTSSHQVEGNNTNDWSEWEKIHAKRLAAEAASHFEYVPHWDEQFGNEARDPNNYLSGNAVDHYRRYEEDFDIARELGHNAHRFSIEWSRVEPHDGHWNEVEIQHYRNVIQALRARDIEPFVTLWHWTLPLWIARKGGVLAPDFPEKFERYAQKIAETLGEHIHFWITLNEPDVVTSHAYLKAAWPPQKKNFVQFLRANYSLVQAHKRSYQSIKKLCPGSEIGIAKHQVSFQTARATIFNTILKKSAHFFWNKWFLNHIRSHQDFIGLNHYNRNVIDRGFYRNPNRRLTDFGWEFFPESIYQAIIELQPYGKPIYITENGIADASDLLRKEFLERAIGSICRAVQDGANVRGYLYWSLLDNFEWDKGFWPRFGLVAVNRKTLERTIRPSAEYYAAICRENAIAIERRLETNENDFS